MGATGATGATGPAGASGTGSGAVLFFEEPGEDQMFFPPGTLDANRAPGPFAFTGVITPTALSGNVNDYDPPGGKEASTWRIDPGGASARDVTGIAGGTPGRRLRIINISTTAGAQLTLKHEDALSAAGNRFTFTQAGDVLLIDRESMLLEYDAVSSRWRQCDKNQPQTHGVNHINGIDDVPLALGCNDVATNGTNGIVPAPSVGQAKYVLRATRAGAGNTLPWTTYSDAFDSAFTSTQGHVFYRSGSAWTTLGPGTSGQFLKTQGAAANPVWADTPGVPVSIQTFYTAGNFTWTRPAGVGSIRVRCIGGGGSGGGVSCTVGNTAGSGAGGSGSYTEKWYFTAAASYTGTVGAGGAQVADGANNGNAGGQSSFDNAGTQIGAPGGAGGAGYAGAAVPQTIQGGNGGVPGFGGDVNGGGQPGLQGMVIVDGYAAGGNGGSITPYGRGGVQRFINNTNGGAHGVAGDGIGGGGGGTVRYNTNTNRHGGAGSDGGVIVEEFRA